VLLVLFLLSCCRYSDSLLKPALFILLVFLIDLDHFGLTVDKKASQTITESISNSCSSGIMIFNDLLVAFIHSSHSFAEAA